MLYFNYIKNNKKDISGQEPNNWHNRFEIPLTMQKTLEVLDIIRDPRYAPYINSVYLPLHGEDGISARPFYKGALNKYAVAPGYIQSKKEWIKLIKTIAQEKAVVLTAPYLRNINIVKEYIKYGISEIMVDNYWPELDQVKKQIKISRSIISHHDDDFPIDKRFDSVIVPYRKTMDLAWLEKNSRNFELIAIINHHCLIECPHRKYFENIQQKRAEGRFDNNDYREPRSPACYIYDETCSAMLPQGIAQKLTKYISRYKLIERLASPAFYLNFMNYYVFKQDFILEPNNEDNFLENRTIKMMRDKEANYRGSPLETLDCKFACKECLKKCYGIADWRNI